MKIKVSKVYLVIVLFVFLRFFMTDMVPALMSISRIFSYIFIIMISALIILIIKPTFSYSELILIGFMFVTFLIAYFHSYLAGPRNNEIILYPTWILSYLLFLIYPLKIEIPKNSWIQILKVFYFISLISAVYALIFQLNSNVFQFRSADNWNLDNTFIAFWNHRNVFSIVLVSGIISSYLLLLNEVYSKKKMVFSIGIMTFCCILTFSRSVFALLGVSAGLYAVLNIRKNKLIPLTLSISLISILYMYLNNPTVSNFIDTFIIRQNSGLTGRDTLWEYGLTYLDRITLLIGRGLGIERTLLSSDTVGAGTGFHNMYLTYLLAGGIPLLAVVSIVFLQNIRYLNKFKHQLGIQQSKFMISVTVGFMVYAYFEVVNFFMPDITSIILTIFALFLPRAMISLFVQINNVTEVGNNETSILNYGSQ